jgi:hypothetical protein
MSDSFGARSTLTVSGRDYEIYRLDALQERFDVARLPYSLKVLLENALRLEARSEEYGIDRYGREESPIWLALHRGDLAAVERRLEELEQPGESLLRSRKLAPVAARLDALAASVRERDVVGVLLLAAQSPRRSQVGDDLGSAVQRREPHVPVAGERGRHGRGQRAHVGQTPGVA